MRTTQAPKNKKNILIIIAISAIVLLAAGYGAFAYAQSIWPFSHASVNESGDARTQEEIDELNAEDPTYPSDKNESNEDSTQNTDTETNKSSVQVGISSAGKFNNTVEVRAFTSGVIEGSGTCTATFTKGNQTITEASSGFIDTHTTQCQPIVIQANQFEAGTWSLIVSYESADYKGASNPMEINL
jgi:hypothetical protein